MTEELFREDAYLKTCEATVTHVTAGEVTLDRTIFYPEGGGQPGDTGILLGTDGTEYTVIDTVKGGTKIHHLLDEDAPFPKVGDKVTAILDWDRRYTHMRMHTALHLLCSQVPFPVTGGQVSTSKSRLDFDMEQGIDKDAVTAELNRLIAEDHAVVPRWITDEELLSDSNLVRTMSVKPPMGSGRVRLMDIQGVDLQACGGTHVARTGEIGQIRVGKVENKGKHNRRVNILFAD